ncbi:Protein of unknown function [Gryllus bimaculatus]|nr:Protein of unknown function [Gryllus bimaculatus]
MDRGALTYSTENVVTVLSTNYIVVKKLCPEMENEFFNLKNQRTVAASLTIDNVQVLEDDSCAKVKGNRECCKDDSLDINCFLNNYCKKQNDVERVRGGNETEVADVSLEFSVSNKKQYFTVTKEVSLGGVFLWVAVICIPT